ncbi:hypothetical protein ACO0R3_000873 [Hanseniaspora guilliermondii]
MTPSYDSTASQNNLKVYSCENEPSLQSISTIRNVGNSNIKETSQLAKTGDVQGCEHNNKYIPRRNSTVARLTSKLVDIKRFKLSRKSNKHQKIILKAVAKVPKRNIINRKLFPSFSKTVDSDLGVLPAILTKSVNTLIISNKSSTKDLSKSNYVLEKNTKNNYYPMDDPLVNHSNPIELPITSTPEKTKRNTVSNLEKMIDDMDVYSMSYDTSTPLRKKADNHKKSEKERRLKIKKDFKD